MTIHGIYINILITYRGCPKKKHPSLSWYFGKYICWIYTKRKVQLKFCYHLLNLSYSLERYWTKHFIFYFSEIIYFFWVFGDTRGCLFCKFTIFRSRIIINKVDLILKKYLNISIMKTKTKTKKTKKHSLYCSSQYNQYHELKSIKQ